MVFRIMSLVGRLISKLRKSSCNQCTLSYNYIQSRNLQFEASSDLAKSQLKQGFNLKEDFLSEEEEQEILGEVNHRFMRRKYNKGHWDGAIVLYREMEKLEWNVTNMKIMRRFEKHVFGSEDNFLSATHVLDLHEDGYIKPHIDSIKFCGALVSGLSLLSDAVMRLQLDENNYADVLIPRRSVYIMSNDVRYKYTHEILPNVASVCGKEVNRTRRITVMKRSKESDHHIGS